MQRTDKTNVAQKLGLLNKPWAPGIIGQVNDTHIKVVKLAGEFIWHTHEAEDELFWVMEGELHMHFRDKVVVLQPGEFIVIPHGVEHKPEAPQGASVVLIEPATTVNTGDGPASERTHDAGWL
jgi:mannose-6-phosphate isomerase-like protein (cupin superfamily)